MLILSAQKTKFYAFQAELNNKTILWIVSCIRECFQSTARHCSVRRYPICRWVQCRYFNLFFCRYTCDILVAHHQANRIQSQVMSDHPTAIALPSFISGIIAGKAVFRLPRFGYPKVSQIRNTLMMKGSYSERCQFFFLDNFSNHIAPNSLYHLLLVKTSGYNARSCWRNSLFILYVCFEMKIGLKFIISMPFKHCLTPLLNSKS